MLMSRSNDRMSHKKQSQLFISALGPNKRHNPHKDPFEALSIKSCTKLMPVSPSGMHLPKLCIKSSMCSPKNALISPPLSVKPQKKEKIFTFVRNKSEKKLMLTPKTPKCRLNFRRFSMCNEISVSHKAKFAESAFLDVSFGNNS